MIGRQTDIYWPEPTAPILNSFGNHVVRTYHASGTFVFICIILLKGCNSSMRRYDRSPNLKSILPLYFQVISRVNIFDY